MEPATIAAVGSFLGGAGRLASAFGKSSGSSDFSRKLARNPLMYQIRDAEKYGIHPLAAIGIQPRYAAAQKVGQKNDFHKMGQAINTMARSPLERKLALIKIEQEKAQLKNMNLNNVGLQKEVEALSTNQPSGVGKSPLQQHLGITGQAPIKQPTLGVTFENVRLPMSKSTGLTAGVGPLESQSINKHGTLYEHPSKELQEVMESDLFTQAKYVTSKGIDYIRGFRPHIGVKGSKGIRLSRARLLKMRPQAPAGYQYRYNALRGSWVLRKRQFGDSYLLDTRKSRKPRYGGKTVKWR